MADALPPSPPVLIVEAAADHSPQIFLGFTAYGSQDDLARLEKAATKSKIPAQPCPDDVKERFIMIAFPPDGRQSTYLNFYSRALAGEFGQLRLEIALLPAAKAQRGLEEAIATDPDYIAMPALDGKKQ